jgi:hypothetical protein
MRKRPKTPINHWPDFCKASAHHGSAPPARPTPAQARRRQAAFIHEISRAISSPIQTDWFKSIKVKPIDLNNRSKNH